MPCKIFRGFTVRSELHNLKTDQTPTDNSTYGRVKEILLRSEFDLFGYIRPIVFSTILKCDNNNTRDTNIYFLKKRKIMGAVLLIYLEQPCLVAR